MTLSVTRTSPHPGVAVVTMSNPEINNHGSWAGIGQLADEMAAAREDGALVMVLASGVPGHWFEHAWLTDLVAAMKGEPTTGEGAAWSRALEEIGRDPRRHHCRGVRRLLRRRRRAGLGLRPAYRGGTSRVRGSRRCRSP